MARTKPWLKMWVESLDDPKMLRLTLAEEATWWRLLRLAQRCNAGGSLITSSGSPLTTDEIAACLHITSPDDMAAFNSMLKKMETEGSLCWNNKTLHIIHFIERQEMVTSETPEAIRERVRLFRERHRVTETPLPPQRKVTDVTAGPPGSSPLQPPITIRREEEEEEEEEKRRYVTAGNPLPTPGSNEKSVTSPPNPLGATTVASRYLFEKAGRKRWQNPVQKELFETTENEVGEQRMKEAVNWALASGITNVKSICTAAKRGGKGGHYGTGYKPPKPEGASKPGRTIDAEREAGSTD